LGRKGHNPHPYLVVFNDAIVSSSPTQQPAAPCARHGPARALAALTDAVDGRFCHGIGVQQHHGASSQQRKGGAQTAAWEAQKAQERAARAETGTLAGVPSALPALTRAEKLTKRAARVGFDWPDAASVLDKLEEEAAELRAELAAAEPARLADELGDLLFVLANLARKLGLNPETTLQAANRKFTRRFEFVEAALAAQGQAPADATLAEMEAAWRAAKLSGL
jgi:ATP diphosphatase